MYIYIILLDYNIYMIIIYISLTFPIDSCIHHVHGSPDPWCRFAAPRDPRRRDAAALRRGGGRRGGAGGGGAAAVNKGKAGRVSKDKAKTIGKP